MYTCYDSITSHCHSFDSSPVYKRNILCNVGILVCIIHYYTELMDLQCILRYICIYWYWDCNRNLCDIVIYIDKSNS